MHDIEIDQSGKLEDTRVATALAFANGITGTLLVPAAVKRQAIQLLRSQNKQGARATLKLFSACLYLLLKNHLKQIDHITIDVEYHGHDAEIKGMLLYYLRKDAPRFPKTKILFQRIGKKSPAHDLAIAVFRKEKKSAHTLTYPELQNLLTSPEKKKRGGAH